MHTEVGSLTDRERRLQEVVLEYLQAVDTGQAPTPKEVLALYPDLAAELAAFFTDEEGLGPLLTPLRQLTAAPAPVPTHLGDYEVLEEIGRGGMGVVYRARQGSLNRLVAVKLLRDRALASPAERDRFRREAESAAHLDHPHIAPVYEVGEHAGQLYFSMKLIDGKSLAQHLSESRPLGSGGADRSLTVAALKDQRGAARLVTTVARAVHHAHQRGVLHRDLKPGNILLDEQGVPYVTDFGLAKRLEGDGRLTQSGAIVGTPEYLAPEQAQADSRLTIAADVYSLGVVLYELLTGRVPFRGNDVLQTLRQVVEQEPAPVRKFAPEVDRDLETVCLKCLAKDPGRRYGSAEALAEDLERWRAGVPIAARPAGRLERIWRWCRRKPAQAGLAAALLLLAIFTVVAPTVSLVLLRAEKERGDEEAAIAKAVNDFWLNDVLGQADIANQPAGAERDKNITVRDLLDRAAERIDARFQGRERTEAAIRRTLGMTYRALGEYPQAHKHLERALALRQEKLGASHYDTLQSMNELAAVWLQWGHPDKAEPLFQEALEGLRATRGCDHSDTLTVMMNLAVLESESGRYDSAEARLKQAVEGFRNAFGVEHPKTLQAMGNLAGLYSRRGRYAEAVEMTRQVIDGLRAVRGADHPETLLHMRNLGTTYMLDRKYDEAEQQLKDVLELYRAKLGVEHPDTLTAVNDLAFVYLETKRYDQAEELFRPALAASRVKPGKQHPLTHKLTEGLARVSHMRAHYDDAEALFKEVLEARRLALGEEHRDTLISLNNLGGHYFLRGLYDQAEPLFLEAATGARKRFGLSHAHTRQCIKNLAAVYEKLGRPELADPLRRELAELKKQP